MVHSRLIDHNLAIASSKDDICDLLGELIKQEQSRKQRRINNHQSLGNQAEITLFNTLERNEQTSGKSQRKTDASELAYLIAAIKNIDIGEVIDSNPQQLNTRGHLQQLLEHNHLIGRDVLISGENLKSDCGDLVAFEEEGGEAILLKTTKRGYQILDPRRMKSAKDINKCPEILEQLSPRMVAINRSLSKKDLSTLGLLQFAFGSKTLANTPSPDCSSAYQSVFFQLGVMLGFTLDFTLGASGGLLGAAWATSPGFRSGIALMSVATGLAMLTPTFNNRPNNALPDQDLRSSSKSALYGCRWSDTVVLEWPKVETCY